jgi:hypothetical protein
MSNQGNTEPVCGNCRFWEKIRHGDGLCRRYAPRAQQEAVVTNPNTGEIERWAVFPMTDRDGWCGEFQQTQVPE